MKMPPVFDSIINDSIASISALHSQEQVFGAVVEVMLDAFANGGKVLAAGNGGSAAEAMHIAEELSGRYHENRMALSAMALCADGTALTCIANDFGFENIFSRQVEAFGRKGDILCAFSTSGNSENILRAAKSAKAIGMTVVAFTGRGGGALANLSDYMFDIPGNNAHVQEAHQVILHALLEHIDAAILSNPAKFNSN